MGSPWESVLPLRSSAEGLSAAILQFHVLIRRQRGSLCSLIFRCGNKMPGTWKKGDLFWLMISEAS